MTQEEQHDSLKHQLGVSYMLCTMLRDVYSDFIAEARKVHTFAGNKKFNKAVNEAMLAMNNAQRHLNFDLDMNNSQENKKAFSDDYLEVREYLENYFKK